VVKRGKAIVLAIVVFTAEAIVFTWNDDGGSGPVYAPYSTGDTGTGLFHDTLRRMGYPVSVGYAPLTRENDVRHAYILIQPFNPYVTREMAEEMLEWVRGGGRLVFLHNTNPTVVDNILASETVRTVGQFNYYNVGAGSVVTGRAQPITNRPLLSDPGYAATLHGIITQWQAERIVFPVYYHGVHPPETMFSNLPPVMRLVIIQLVIAVLALLWHLGKRFGKPIPAYGEMEREENEYVRALARLYMKKERKDQNVEDDRR